MLKSNHHSDQKMINPTGAAMRTVELNSLYKQRGVSKFGLLMLFLMIGSFFTVGIKVAPIYIDHNLIAGICEELIENGEAATMTTTALRQRVSNSLRINNITDFDLSDIRLRRENGAPVITINYERRVELVANLDIVAKFDTVLQ